jgi:glycogen phosphorylase
MNGKTGKPAARTPSLPGIAELLEEYGCGAIQFTGTNDAIYERHLMFDNAVDAAAAAEARCE